jgi:isoleucyl-tRNA synthetase
MALLREIASLGRSARMNAKLKVRQPLAKVEVILANPRQRQWLEDHAALIEDELNVKHVEFTETADQYIRYSVAPDFKRLGPRLGKQMPAVKQALAQADAAELLARLKSDGRVMLNLPDGDVTLDEEDLQVRLDAKPGWSAAQGSNCVVVLSTELTDALVQEGLARDVVRAIQDRRKELQCNYTDRIVVGAVSESLEVREAIRAFSQYIMQETLAVQLELAAINGAESTAADIAGHALKLFVMVVPVKAMSNDS